MSALSIACWKEIEIVFLLLQHCVLFNNSNDIESFSVLLSGVSQHMVLKIYNIMCAVINTHNGSRDPHARLVVQQYTALSSRNKSA